MYIYAFRTAPGEIFLSGNKEDEFSGLMTPRERQWIVNIQLNQLKCENPFLDDYYYTVFNQKRNSTEHAIKGNTKIKKEKEYETEDNNETEKSKGSRYFKLTLFVSERILAMIPSYIL